MSLHYLKSTTTRVTAAVILSTTTATPHPLALALHTRVQQVVTCQLANCFVWVLFVLMKNTKGKFSVAVLGRRIDLKYSVCVSGSWRRIIYSVVSKTSELKLLFDHCLYILLYIIIHHLQSQMCKLITQTLTLVILNALLHNCYLIWQTWSAKYKTEHDVQCDRWLISTEF